MLRRRFDEDRVLITLWVVCTIAIVVPVWTQRLLPMLDTPNHLALVRGWHNYHDPSWHISDFYTLRVRPVPYVLFYGAIHLLMYAFDIETANKIYLTAYLILFPLAFLSLAKALKRSAWHALPGFALAFTPAWIYGFSSYMMATVFLYFALAALIRLLDEHRRRDAWILFLYCTLLYFAHVMAWFTFGIIAIALLVAEASKQRARLVDAVLAMAPSVALGIIAVLEEKGDRSYMREEGFLARWRDVPTSVLEFPKRAMELFPGPLDMIILALLVLLAVLLWRWRDADAEEELCRRRRLRFALWALALLYLSLPYEIVKPMSWWYVAPRIPAIMVPLAILLPPSLTTRRTRVLMIPVLIAIFVLSGKLVVLYRDFSRRHIAFMQLVEQTPIGATTLVVTTGMWTGQHPEETSGDPATSGPVFWHFSSWPMALRGGISPYIFDQGIPLRFKDKLKTPSWDQVDLFDLRQAPNYRYYLVRFAGTKITREPALRIVDKRGDWTLFERIHELTDEP